MGPALPESGNGEQQLQIAQCIAEGLVKDATQGYETKESKAVTEFIIQALFPLIRVEDFQGVALEEFLENMDDSFLPGFSQLDWQDASAVKAYTENWFRNLPIMAAANVGTVQSGVVQSVVTATSPTPTEIHRLSVWERIRRFGRRKN